MHRILDCIGVVLALFAVISCTAGCDRNTQTKPSSPTSSPTTTPAKSQPEQPADDTLALTLDEPAKPAATRTPAAERIVAIGDIHGDFKAFKEALTLAEVVDEQGNWSGGQSILVQTGDLLDRGDDEPEILALIERLEAQAKQAGGEVIVLNGNHETMNVRGDFRYVTPEGFSDFQAMDGLDMTHPVLEQVPEEKRARVAAFLPGGPVARLLSHHNMVAIVGDSVFVHGGVLPGHVDYGIERINDETRRWMRGDAEAPPKFMQDRELLPPNWVRLYSDAPDAEACATLDEALAALGAKRMVVGHTPQLQGIASACDEKVWRIDVGMASHYGGSPQALEIRGDIVRPLAKTAD
jgi:hypothetical protein